MSKTFTVHPTRTAPLCRDCRWLDRQCERFDFCAHPSAPVDPVRGRATLQAATMRDEAHGPEQTRCGPRAMFFVAAPAPQEEAPKPDMTWNVQPITDEQIKKFFDGLPERRFRVVDPDPTCAACGAGRSEASPAAPGPAAQRWRQAVRRWLLRLASALEARP